MPTETEPRARAAGGVAGGAVGQSQREGGGAMTGRLIEMLAGALVPRRQ
ncbi:hypothetical protein ACU4GD_17300 [Cupriavidus basilensis]